MSKSPRYWLRLASVFIKRFRLILLAGIALGVVFFVFLQFFLPGIPKKTERIGETGEYTIDALPSYITKLISMGLTNIDETGRAIPGIASDWEPSDGGKTWTFHLNKNLHWQDGSGVVTGDINYGFSDATITKPDKYTIVFKLKTPLAPFPVNLSKPIFKKGFLGAGEWKVTGLSLVGTYVETLTLIDHNGNQKQFKFYPTEDRSKLAYELGQVDMVDGIFDSAPFNTWDGLVNLQKTPNKERYVAVFFNTTDSLLGDKDLRQALSYAIDKQSLPDNAGNSNRALGPISPSSWAFNPSVKPYDFDLDHAKELVKAAKISPDDRKNLKIKLTALPDLLPTAEIIAKEWKDLGIDTNILVTAYMPEDYQAFLAISDIPTDPDQYSVWHSTQTQANVSRYKNTRIDKLLEDGRVETDPEKRKQIYFDFQRFLVEDSPAAFLYYPNYYSVSKK